jgi:ribosomal protein S27AE
MNEQEIATCDQCGDTSFTADQLEPQPNGQMICGACSLLRENAQRAFDDCVTNNPNMA